MSSSVQVTSPATSTVRPQADDLTDLVVAFRLLQTQHSRVLHHESTTRGLNATDSRLVFFLAAADDAGVTPKQAGEHLELSTGAMTSLIDRLEQRGHIERRPNPSDRRSILLHLTPSGQAIAQQVGAVWSASFREAIAPEDRRALADAFTRLGSALARRSGATV
jgi:DNA-binding MarR family transcriptional regulator